MSASLSTMTSLRSCTRYPSGCQAGLDNEQRTQTENGYLHEQARCFSDTDDHPRSCGCHLRRLQRTVVYNAPALDHGRQHSHGTHYLGIADRRLGLSDGSNLAHIGLEKRFAGQPIVDDTEREEQHGRAEGEDANVGVQ
jgi:hypothetical protein